MSGTRTTVTFNGVDLTSLYVVSGWHTPLLGRSFDTVDIAGMDGERFLGSTLSPRTITLSLTVKGTSLADREAAARVLASTLAVDEPKALTASFMDGRYYLAIPRSDADLTRFVNADTFEVSFFVPDPVSYGELKTVSITSVDYGTRINFTVGGNYPTFPTVSINARKASTTGASSFAFYTNRQSAQETYTYVDLAAVISGSLLAETITIDSASRTFRAGFNDKMLPLVSDWPLLQPGSNQLFFSEGGSSAGSSGSGTLTYRERWL